MGISHLGRIAYTKRHMMRAATVLIVLFSMLSVPIASAVCGDCCNRSIEHKLPLCHNKAHAHLGPHVDHMNHVHMVTQDSDASVAIQRCDHELRARGVNCHIAGCVSARPVQTSVVPAPSNQQQIHSHLFASTVCSSLPVADPPRPSYVVRRNTSSSTSVALALRV